MRRQKRYDAYDVSSFFANGAAMRVPPENTVSVDASPPMPAISPTLLETGARQYQISCAPCHGAAGFGGGIVATNLTERRPPSLRSAHVASMTPGELFAVVTDGFGTMPPLGWQLSPVLRWAVVAHIQSLDQAPTQLPASIRQRDSLMATYLQHVDSLHAAGVPIEQIMRIQRPRNREP